MHEELWKGLTTAAGSGGPWQDRWLNPMLTDAARKKYPLLAWLNLIGANGNPHEFRRRDRRPRAHYEGDNAASVETQSVVSMQQQALYAVRSRGFATKLLQATMGPDELDVALEEVFAHGDECAMQITGSVIWGDNNANQFMPDGLDADTGVFRLNGGGAAATIAQLDQLLAATSLAGAPDNRVILMSSQMCNRFEQQLFAAGSREIITEDGRFGKRMTHYKNKPILETDQTRPRAQMAAIALAQTAAGALADAHYFYKVAPVTSEGEQLASAEADIVVAGGLGVASVTITITAFAFADGNSPYTDANYYKIYRGVASGAEVLVATVPAFTVDADGTQTAADVTLVDDGTADARGGIAGSLPASVAAADTELLGTTAAPEEVVVVTNWDPEDGIEIPASAMEDANNVQPYDLIGLVPMGRTRDRDEFIVRSFHTVAIKRGGVHGFLRNVLAA